MEALERTVIAAHLYIKLITAIELIQTRKEHSASLVFPSGLNTDLVYWTHYKSLLVLSVKKYSIAPSTKE